MEADFRTTGGRAEADLVVVWGGVRLTAEVKYDLAEARSGNVACEFYNPRAGRPSGLKATTADLWCFVLADGSVWAARTADVVRNFDKAAAGAGYHRLLPACGDGNAAAVLYRRAELFAHCFFRLDDAERWDVEATLTMFAIGC